MINDNIKHIAIIMDGNGRWAKERGLSRSVGHENGAEVLENIALYANKIGLKNLSVYAFSTDNFKRDQKEVDFLMNLFVKMFKKTFKKIVSDGIKVVFSGSKEGLRKDVAQAMIKLENESKENSKCTLNICLNYGGQEEIIRAALKLHDDLNKNKVQKDDVNRENFYKYLDNDLPPIDILIRTGKEKRLSNFMLYELSYAELFFTDKYFPEFTENDLDAIIEDFSKKDRRFGGINDKK